jgi:hypothetical protein
MKVKELIEELQKYDGDLEIRIYKKPVRKVKRIAAFKVKDVSHSRNKETREIISVSISF